MEMFMRRIKIITIIFMFILTGCSTTPEYQNKKESHFLIGTIVTLNLYHEDEQVLNQTMAEIVEHVKASEQIFSRRIETSELYQLNNSKLTESKVSEDLYYLIKQSLYYNTFSSGYFDVTMLPVIELWGIDTDNPKLPAPDDIISALTHVGSEGIHLSSDKDTPYMITYDTPGIQIDLGGIAKGYITDEIVKILIKNDIPFGIIDLGGNLYVHGKKNGSEDWTLGIRDPEGSATDLLGKVTLNNKSLVTSGGYERFFEFNGSRYHHILDPFTGYPVESGLKSVSIISDSSIDCDALSTAIFAMGLTDGLAAINALENTECIIVTNENKVYLSEGLTSNFSLISDLYTLVD